MVRVALSAAFAALLALNPASPMVDLTPSAAALAGAAASLNVLWNALQLVRPTRTADRTGTAVAQLLLDGLLALIAAILLDPTATPLSWIALLVPVLDAAALFGSVLAGVTWIAVGLVYAAVRMRLSESGADESALLLLGLQQLAAVAAIAVPTGYLAARLRDDLDQTHHTLVEARRRATELELVAGHSTKLTAAADADRVVSGMLNGTLCLGFDRAEVCVRQRNGGWAVTHAAGEGPLHAVDADLGAAEAVEHGRPIVIGADGRIDHLQELHLYGFEGCVVMPLWQSKASAAVVRAWSSEPLGVDDSNVGAVRLLSAQASAAWETASRYVTLRRWSQRVEYEATHDSLTGLANRPHLLARLGEAIEAVVRTNVPFALLYLDLNGFKQVNDRYGHDAGDVVLVSVAKRLLRLVREDDLVARLGGDEFVVLLPAPGSIDDAVEVARRVCANLSAPVLISGREVPIGTSVGVAWGTGDDNPEALLRKADAAMYRAKALPRSGYVLARGVPALRGTDEGGDA